MSKKPGVMVYFELRCVLDALSDQESGQLFRIILEYGETGVEPEIPDKLRIVWPLIKMRLMNDDQRYQTICEQNAYKNYCQQVKKHGDTPQAFEQWLYDSDRRPECP